MVVPGILLKSLDECLGYARSVQPASPSIAARYWFHTYWHPSLDQTRVATMIESFDATQPCLTSGHQAALGIKLWLLDPEHELLLIQSAMWANLQPRLQDRLTFDLWSATTHPSFIFGDHMETPWLLGLDVLYTYGGVWFPPMTYFNRDWSPLLTDREWITSTDCSSLETIDPEAMSFYLFPNSTNACQLSSTIRHALAASAMVPGWVFGHVYRSMLRHHAQPWLILPWCYMNPTSGCDAASRSLRHLAGDPALDAPFRLALTIENAQIVQHAHQQRNRPT
ncbi:hypothetical protein DM01DRAFT_1335188 [Hesseltinella vesiculosa]|uniref:Nucleotide-diphospho-sugar transferase domain-containing protein n=1 Tax=Hesseltinella vesiculosa TaxID=101127 RepID=A0A1X2GKI4_9FUNG|nr:hypothetical protein DM01DRAFT_1335188 [Hesseltinella vesiculosa]